MIWWKYQQLRLGTVKTRLAVVEKLAETFDEKAVNLLILALDDKHSDVRCVAAKALVRYHDRRAVEPLVNLLQDSEPLARAAAAETLGRLGDPLAINPLAGVLRDADPVVRGIAARSLDRLGWQPVTESQRVLHILGLGSLHQLAALGPEGVGHLLEVLRNGTPNKQVAAVKALGKTRDPRVTPAMLTALNNHTPAVRTAALDVLANLGDPSTFSAVEKLLSDGNANVRISAVEAATSSGGVRAVSALVKCLKDTSWEVRKDAADSLGLLGDRSAVDGLCVLVQDPDRDVRESAITALGHLGDRAALVPLVPALLDPESVVRSAAAAALQKIDPSWQDATMLSDALPKIQAALKHPEYWVRHCATKLLEQLKIQVNVGQDEVPAKLSKRAPAHPAFPVLADLLFNRDRDLRLAAAVALGRLREPAAGPLLTNAVRDADYSVRQAVLSALTALN
jgi:HEAT repeat protein